MKLALSCTYCGYIFADEERVCPMCAANREEAHSEPHETGLEQGSQQDPMQKVIQLLKGRRKIDAIKLYREIHSVGLREAKKAIDRLEKDIK